MTSFVSLLFMAMIPNQTEYFIVLVCLLINTIITTNEPTHTISKGARNAIKLILHPN